MNLHSEHSESGIQSFFHQAASGQVDRHEVHRELSLQEANEKHKGRGTGIPGPRDSAPVKIWNLGSSKT
jgi:hypothetical protein